MAFAGFSPRELQVIALRAKGLTAEQIAKKLGCSRALVYEYTYRVHCKTGIKDRAELRRWAIQFGLDEPVEAGIADAPEAAPVSTPLGHTL